MAIPYPSPGVYLDLPEAEGRIEEAALALPLVPFGEQNARPHDLQHLLGELLLVHLYAVRHPHLKEAPQGYSGHESSIVPHLPKHGAEKQSSAFCQRKNPRRTRPRTYSTKLSPAEEMFPGITVVYLKGDLHIQHCTYGAQTFSAIAEGEHTVHTVPEREQVYTSMPEGKHTYTTVPERKHTYTSGEAHIHYCTWRMISRSHTTTVLMDANPKLHTGPNLSVPKRKNSDASVVAARTGSCSRSAYTCGTPRA